MNCDWQRELREGSRTSAIVLPPVTVAETGWDILLLLNADRRSQLSLDKLAALASIPPSVLTTWLAGLEEKQLLTGARDGSTGELRAVLTPRAAELLDKYLWATSGLEARAVH